MQSLWPKRHHEKRKFETNMLDFITLILKTVENLN